MERNFDGEIVFVKIGKETIKVPEAAKIFAIQLAVDLAMEKYWRSIYCLIDALKQLFKA